MLFLPASSLTKINRDDRNIKYLVAVVVVVVVVVVVAAAAAVEATRPRVASQSSRGSSLLSLPLLGSQYPRFPLLCEPLPIVCILTSDLSLSLHHIHCILLPFPFQFLLHST